MMSSLEVIRQIDPAARVSPQATIGLHCVIGPNVTIGPQTVLSRRVSVEGNTTIGEGNFFDEGCVLGTRPQDLKYRGHNTLLIIGHRNHFGRKVTAHIGTETGGFVTRIGNDNFFSDAAHIAHDCFVDDNTHLGKDVLLAGHIRVQEGAVIGDLVGVHQFVTIGKYARVGSRTPIRRDVPPYTDFYSENYDWGSPPSVKGLHEEGIAAAKLNRDEEKDLRRALQELFDDEAALQTKIEQFINTGVEGEVAELCQFIQQSLQGVFGRHRELLRGEVPPESEPYLTPEMKAALREKLP